MYRIKHNELKGVIKHYSDKKKTLIVLGRTGIGKSSEAFEMSQERAKDLNKEFIKWNDTDLETKRAVIKEPDKYYVYIDIRLTQIEPSDLRGIPDLKGEAVEWLPNLWVIALSKCEGTLLLDEINLCPPSIQAVVYQILLDREVGEIPLNKKVLIIGCGNVAEDKAGVYELAKPIMDRGGMFELQTPDRDTMFDYAVAHDWDSRVSMYIYKNPSKIFVDDENSDTIVTPRSHHIVSDLIKGIDDLDKINLFSGGIYGEGIAMEFTAFIKLMDKIPSPDSILNGKAKIPNDIDLKYACVSAIVEYYRHKEDKRKENLIKVIELKDKIDAEFYILMLRLVKSIDNEVMKQIVQTEHFDKVAEYSKYF